MHALIAGNADRSVDIIAAVQLYPFFRYRQQLRRALDLTFDHVQAASVSEIERACERIGDDVDVLFVRPDWRDDPDEVIGVMKWVRKAHPRLPVLFIDPWDQVSSRFFGVLPYVTKLLKYQRLKDVDGYHPDLHGGTVITDHLVRECGQDLYGWSVSSPVPEGYQNRIASGWNVVVSRKFERLLFRPWWERMRRPAKDIDLCCHMSYSSIHDKASWYTDYRKQAVAAANALGPKYRLAVSGEHPEKRTVSSEQYRSDLARSRIVFSPFGWGETTWRDYEAVCYDSLLLKPDISHIATEPDIYRAGETYVPLKWDFSDLEEKSAYYLAHPDKAARIVANARRTLESYFIDHRFVSQIGELLSGVRADVPARVPTSLRDSAAALV